MKNKYIKEYKEGSFVGGPKPKKRYTNVQHPHRIFVEDGDKWYYTRDGGESYRRVYPGQEEFKNFRDERFKYKDNSWKSSDLDDEFRDDVKSKAKIYEKELNEDVDRLEYYQRNGAEKYKKKYGVPFRSDSDKVRGGELKPANTSSENTSDTRSNISSFSMLPKKNNFVSSQNSRDVTIPDSKFSLSQNVGTKKNPEWVKDILSYESQSGSAGGTGLKNYGIQRDKWGKKYKYLDKDVISEQDAIQFISDEFLPMVKDYPEDVQKRLVDYAYNTGRNIEDVLLYASGYTDLESVQTKATDYDTFNKNRDAILKSMSDPEFVSKIDKAKHEILSDYWTRQGTPEVYDKTSKGRIDMWNKSNPAPSTNPVQSSPKTPVDSKQVLRNFIDKKKESMTGRSWTDKDISDLLSPGIAAQDWRLESLTDAGMGKPVEAPPTPGATVNIPAPKKEVQASSPAESTERSSGYKLVKGGTEAVAKYQEMLKSEGFYKGPIDGAWDSKNDAGKGKKSETQLAYEAYLAKNKGGVSNNVAKPNIQKNKVENSSNLSVGSNTNPNQNAIDAVKKMNDQMEILQRGNKVIDDGLDKIKIDEDIYQSVLKRGSSGSEDWIKGELDKWRKGFYERSGLRQRTKIKAFEELLRRKKAVPKMKKGGYIRHMVTGGVAGDPPKGRRFQNLKNKNVIIIEGQDGKTYSSMDGGKTYKEAPPQIKDAFSKEFSEQQNQKWLNWQRIGGDGIENDPSAQRPKIEPLQAIGKRPLSILSTGRKYVDNRFNGNPDEAPKNPGLTMDPTDWGQDIVGNKNPLADPSVSEAPKNPGLTMDGSSWGQEIKPGLNYSDISNPFAPEGGPLGNNPSSSVPGDSGMTDVEKKIQDEIEKRKKDVTENAANTIEDYEDLTDRTNSRNLQGLIVSTAGRLLQDRRVNVAFKRPNYINQRYRGYSAQQIAQETQSASGAAVEMVKAMGRDPSAVTARIAPILMARMGAQEGASRKSYNDYNMNLERAKYGELNDIINTNDKIRADQVNTERDMGNRTIAGLSSDVGKFIQSINQTDGKMVDIKSRVNQQKINDLYSLDNSSIEMELAKMDYNQQKDYLDKRMNDIRAELENDELTLDDEYRKKLEDNLAAYERMKDKANIKNSLKK